VADRSASGDSGQGCAPSVQVGVHLGHELVEGRLPRVSRSERTRLRVGLHLRVDGAEQRLLAREVVVHRTLGNAGRIRDLLDRRMRVTLPAKQGTGGGEHRSASGLGVLRSEHGRRLGASISR
jgi:hypothetical protein